MRAATKLLSKRHLQKLLLLLILDALLFSQTNARNVVSIILVLGFGLLLATAYYFFYALLALAGLYGLKTRHQKRLTACLTGVFGTLIALQSVGELSPRDALVVLPIGLIVYLYSSYGASKRSQML